MNYKRFFRFAALSIIAILGFACSKDETADNRDTDYGYVQFKIYKEASYEEEAHSRAVVSQLDYLHNATKITVRMQYGESSISQTLNLYAADDNAAEYGMRSDKLKLLQGDYTVLSYTLYDLNDEPVYRGSADNTKVVHITAGGLSTYDLTANVTPRGKVRFTLYKENIDKDTRAAGDFTLDEIATAEIVVRNRANGQYTTFTNIKTKFEVLFDENNDADGTFGYRTSVLKCDSLFEIQAGDYYIYRYSLYKDRSTTAAAVQTHSDANPIPADFTVEDNKTTEAKVGITLSLEADYIKDYRALKAIWESLHGEEWSYNGENFPKGCNWNFNKDIDLWGDQPGVQLHSNGRVARLDLSDFGVYGEIPEDLGQLDQMVELYLGTHNDVNLTFKDPSIDLTKSLSDRRQNRMQYNKQYLAALHPAPQMSEPCARGLREHNIIVPETALYAQGYTEEQIFDPQTGIRSTIKLCDTNAGTICNGITKLPESIGNLKNLEYFYIANSRIKELPQSVGELESLLELEIYNCPEMEKFPVQIAELPVVELINLSNNPQWSAEEIYKGLEALATHEGTLSSLQILYSTDNNLKELPESFSQFQKLGMLDLTNNQIEKLHPLGQSVAPVQLYFDNNKITEFPKKDGYYCQMNDMETFSASNNLLTEVPDIFKTSEGFRITSVDLTGNKITGFPETFSGINVQTLTLTLNPIKKFQNILINKSKSAVAYIVMRGCELEEFDKDCFEGEHSASLQSLDLSYNHLTKLPSDFIATNMPYLYGVDLSHNMFSSFPYNPFDAYTLTIFAIRAQRDKDGRRCLREWPTGVWQHTGLRALYIGSNDIRTVNDTISYMIYYLDISDNPNITFDASDICVYWQAGLYNLIYDKTQNIINCDAMLE